MAEEGTLGLARAREGEATDEEPTKEALQRRMEQARDSITNTVTEIKENVTQQYESVKDALDWREHFKRQPVGWSLGAAGVGLLVGYGIAAAIKGDDRNEVHYASSPGHSLLGQAAVGEVGAAPSRILEATNGKDHGPSVLERLRETSAYEKLSQEAGALGDRFIEELSSTAQAPKPRHCLGDEIRQIRETQKASLEKGLAFFITRELKRGLLRHRLARKFFITHRCVVNERRHDRGRLFHVISLNAIKDVLIRVVRPRIVFNLILNELEAR